MTTHQLIAFWGALILSGVWASSTSDVSSFMGILWLIFALVILIFK